MVTIRKPSAFQGTLKGSSEIQNLLCKSPRCFKEFLTRYPGRVSFGEKLEKSKLVTVAV